MEFDNISEELIADLLPGALQALCDSAADIGSRVLEESIANGDERVEFGSFAEDGAS